MQKILTERDLLITDIIPFCIKYEAIKETYTSSDLKLFNKYSQFEPRIGFFESWVRLESTEKTQEKSLRLRLKDTLGRATKRILYDFKKDPVLGNIQQPDRSYLIKAVKKIIKRRNKKIIV